MLFKPTETAWFETYTPREQTIYAIDALAKSGLIEFYHTNWSTNQKQTETLRHYQCDFSKLSSRFENDLPEPGVPSKTHQKSPEDLAHSSLQTLRIWCANFLRLQRKLAANKKHKRKLTLLKELLLSIPDHDLNFGWIKHESHILCKKIYCCPKGEFNHPAGSELFIRLFPGESHDFILVFGTLDHCHTIEATATLVNCNEIDIPDWALTPSKSPVDDVDDRLADLQQSARQLDAKLIRHRQDMQVKKSLATMRLVSWYLENACPLSHEHNACHLIGWTSAGSAQDLEKILREVGIDSAVTFSSPPETVTPPVQTDQPGWIAPYQFFANLLGTPGHNEIDPAPFLAVIVPLLFGYMFPDLGHGLVLVVTGLLMRQRIPQAQLLIPCGIAASGFGVVFGDVFGRHDIIEPLWLSPLDNPLDVLVIPMAFGAALITLGLVFSGIEARWRGELGKWLQTEASVLVLYIVLIAAVFYTPLLWLMLPIMVWYSVGSLMSCTPMGPACLLFSWGHLAESAFRLILNSLSFIRVGAFALAHSGTSHAANLLTDMIDTPLIAIVFFLFTHAFIILLEGLIVFVQTTRLILFEFFIRFLKADGRVFKPMHGV